MEALHQGISTALVLLGIAALLCGVAALWRAVGNARAQQQDLQLERASHDLAAQRLREQVAQDKSRFDLLYALAPAGAAMLGHWLGSRSQPPELAPCPSPCMGCIPRPPHPMPPPLDDDTQVELDLESIVQGIAELGFDRWFATVMQGAKASPAAPPEDDDPEPTPTVAHGVSG